ncbi:MAG: phosphoribosylglycinamide formyltransferase [Candidatus Magnetoovum sp. WYHC-5]|nr:phosphoribosylglycinamide formyltransferase [Candidatus Magnetoovum sp. WYHC-5]
MPEKLKIAVLASGRGSNFQAIINAIRDGYIDVEVACLISDSPKAFALNRAKEAGIESLYMASQKHANANDYYGTIATELKDRGVGLICLAGFMRIVKKPLIDAYPMRIINIHPALLPSFTGLDGQQKAIDYGAKIAGCTVHFVDEGVDTGPIIVQAATFVYSDDDEESLSQRILNLEHKIYPYAIKLFSEGRLSLKGRVVSIRDEKKEDGFIISPRL